MEVGDFADMVRDVRNAKIIAGGPDYVLTEKERSSTVFRRSLFAVKDIAEGEIITAENVRSIRPGYGIAPKYFKDLEGKPAKRAIKRGEPITEDML